MDEDVFRGVRIVNVTEQIFLTTAHGRSFRCGTQPTCATVPIQARLQVAMFRNMRGVFVVRHDSKPHLVPSHGLQDILPMAEHFTDEIGRLQQGVIRHIIRSHHRKSVYIHMLGVKRIERQRLPHTHRRRGHPISPAQRHRSIHLQTPQQQADAQNVPRKTHPC